MTRTPPTLTELKDTARELLGAAKDSLERARTLIPTIILGDAMDGAAPAIILVEGKTMEDPVAKENLAEQVRKKIDEHGYMYSIMIADTFRMDIDKGRYREADIMQRMFNMGAQDLAKAGFGQLLEQAMVTVQTVTSTTILTMTYSRNEGGQPVSFEPIEERDVTIGHESRFNFFGDRS